VKNRRTDAHERQPAEIDHIRRRIHLRPLDSGPRALAIGLLAFPLDAREIRLRQAIGRAKRVPEGRGQRQRPLDERRVGSLWRAQELEQFGIGGRGAHERPGGIRLALVRGHRCARSGDDAEQNRDDDGL
jgi:hypothetical protein